MYTVEDPIQLEQRAKDATLIERDKSVQKPKPDDTVNVVVGGKGDAFGQIRKATVISVEEVEGGAPVIDVEIPSVKDVVRDGKGKVVKETTRIQRGNPYVSAERLTLKLRPNTWHWPDGAKAKK